MSITPETLVADLVDREQPLADNLAYKCYLEVDAAERFATVVWVEPLRTHAEWNGPRMDIPRLRPAHPDNWSKHVDEDGYLTPEAERALAERLSTLFPEVANGTSIFTGYDDTEDEQPAIRLEFTTSYQPGETFQHWYDRIGWPIVATLINVTDPGTFNNPCLFDMSTLEVEK